MFCFLFFKNNLFYFDLFLNYSCSNTKLMKEKFTQIRAVVVYKAQQTRARLEQNVRKYWLRLLLLGFVGFMLSRKDLSINLSLNAASMEGFSASSVFGGAVETSAGSDADYEEARPMNTSMIQGGSKKSSKPAKKGKSDDNLANTFSNLSFDDSEEARKRAEKRKKQLEYIKDYKGIAVAEMKKYGIPASITLAQGLLESNVGESKLATRNNNHFGIKCFSRTCRKGHCSNFTDDSHKDFFRAYKSAKESYRAHSLLLKNGKRYNRLFKLRSTDYSGWAHGLSKAGYATDKRYAYKIINLIKDLDLHKYDD